MRKYNWNAVIFLILLAIQSQANILYKHGTWYGQKTIIVSPLARQDANYFCQGNGYRLSSISSAQQVLDFQDAVQNASPPPPQSRFWVDIIQGNNAWVHQNGAPINFGNTSYLSVGDTIPDTSKCAYFNLKDLQYGLANCSDPLPSICDHQEYPAPALPFVNDWIAAGKLQQPLEPLRIKGIAKTSRTVSCAYGGYFTDIQTLAQTTSSQPPTSQPTLASSLRFRCSTGEVVVEGLGAIPDDYIFGKQPQSEEWGQCAGGFVVGMVASQSSGMLTMCCDWNVLLDSSQQATAGMLDAQQCHVGSAANFTGFLSSTSVLESTTGYGRVQLCGANKEQVLLPQTFIVDFSPQIGISGILLVACKPVFMPIPHSSIVTPPGLPQLDQAELETVLSSDNVKTFNPDTEFAAFPQKNGSDSINSYNVTYGWADIRCQGMPADFCWRQQGSTHVTCQLSAQNYSQQPVFTSTYEVLASDFTVIDDKTHYTPCMENNIPSADWSTLPVGNFCLECSEDGKDKGDEDPDGGTSSGGQQQASSIYCRPRDCQFTSYGQWFIRRGSAIESALFPTMCIALFPGDANSGISTGVVNGTSLQVVVKLLSCVDTNEAYQGIDKEEDVGSNDESGRRRLVSWEMMREIGQGNATIEDTGAVLEASQRGFVHQSLKESGEKGQIILMASVSRSDSSSSSYFSSYEGDDFKELAFVSEQMDSTKMYSSGQFSSGMQSSRQLQEASQPADEESNLALLQMVQAQLYASLQSIDPPLWMQDSQILLNALYNDGGIPLTNFGACENDDVNQIQQNGDGVEVAVLSNPNKKCLKKQWDLNVLVSYGELKDYRVVHVQWPVFCTWEGVRCSGQGSVLTVIGEIHVEEEAWPSGGMFSSWWFKLANVKVLSFPNSALEGELPLATTVDLVSNMRQITIRSNKLNTQLPMDWASRYLFDVSLQNGTNISHSIYDHFFRSLLMQDFLPDLALIDLQNATVNGTMPIAYQPPLTLLISPQNYSSFDPSLLGHRLTQQTSFDTKPVCIPVFYKSPLFMPPPEGFPTISVNGPVGEGFTPSNDSASAMQKLFNVTSVEDLPVAFCSQPTILWRLQLSSQECLTCNSQIVKAVLQATRSSLSETFEGSIDLGSCVASLSTCCSQNLVAHEEQNSSQEQEQHPPTCMIDVNLMYTHTFYTQLDGVLDTKPIQDNLAPLLDIQINVQQLSNTLSNTSPAQTVPFDAPTLAPTPSSPQPVLPLSTVLTQQLAISPHQSPVITLQSTAHPPMSPLQVNMYESQPLEPSNALFSPQLYIAMPPEPSHPSHTHGITPSTKSPPEQADLPAFAPSTRFPPPFDDGPTAVVPIGAPQPMAAGPDPYIVAPVPVGLAGSFGPSAGGSYAVDEYLEYDDSGSDGVGDDEGGESSQGIEEIGQKGEDGSGGEGSQGDGGVGNVGMITEKVGEGLTDGGANNDNLDGINDSYQLIGDYTDNGQQLPTPAQGDALDEGINSISGSSRQKLNLPLIIVFSSVGGGLILLVVLLFVLVVVRERRGKRLRSNRSRRKQTQAGVLGGGGGSGGGGDGGCGGVYGFEGEEYGVATLQQLSTLPELSEEGDKWSKTVSPKPNSTNFHEHHTPSSKHTSPTNHHNCHIPTNQASNSQSNTNSNTTTPHSAAVQDDGTSQDCTSHNASSTPVDKPRQKPVFHLRLLTFLRGGVDVMSVESSYDTQGHTAVSIQSNKKRRKFGNVGKDKDGGVEDDVSTTTHVAKQGILQSIVNNAIFGNGKGHEAPSGQSKQNLKVHEEGLIDEDKILESKTSPNPFDVDTEVGVGGDQPNTCRSPQNGLQNSSSGLTLGMNAHSGVCSLQQVVIQEDLVLGEDSFESNSMRIVDDCKQTSVNHTSRQKQRWVRKWKGRQIMYGSSFTSSIDKYGGLERPGNTNGYDLATGVSSAISSVELKQAQGAFARQKRYHQFVEQKQSQQQKGVDSSEQLVASGEKDENNSNMAKAVAQQQDDAGSNKSNQSDPVLPQTTLASGKPQKQQNAKGLKHFQPQGSSRRQLSKQSSLVEQLSEYSSPLRPPIGPRQKPLSPASHKRSEQLMNTLMDDKGLKTGYSGASWLGAAKLAHSPIYHKTSKSQQGLKSGGGKSSRSSGQYLGEEPAQDVQLNQDVGAQQIQCKQQCSMQSKVWNSVGSKSAVKDIQGGIFATAPDLQVGMLNDLVVEGQQFDEEQNMRQGQKCQDARNGTCAMDADASAQLHALASRNSMESCKVSILNPTFENFNQENMLALSNRESNYQLVSPHQGAHTIDGQQKVDQNNNGNSKLPKSTSQVNGKELSKDTSSSATTYSSKQQLSSGQSLQPRSSPPTHRSLDVGSKAWETDSDDSGKSFVDADDVNKADKLTSQGSYKHSSSTGAILNLLQRKSGRRQAQSMAGSQASGGNKNLYNGADKFNVTSPTGKHFSRMKGYSAMIDQQQDDEHDGHGEQIEHFQGTDKGNGSGATGMYGAIHGNGSDIKSGHSSALSSRLKKALHSVSSKDSRPTSIKSQAVDQLPLLKLIEDDGVVQVTSIGQVSQEGIQTLHTSSGEIFFIPQPPEGDSLGPPHNHQTLHSDTELPASSEQLQSAQQNLIDNQSNEYTQEILNSDPQSAHIKHLGNAQVQIQQWNNGSSSQPEHPPIIRQVSSNEIGLHTNPLVTQNTNLNTTHTQTHTNLHTHQHRNSLHTATQSTNPMLTTKSNAVPPNMQPSFIPFSAADLPLGRPGRRAGPRGVTGYLSSFVDTTMTTSTGGTGEGGEGFKQLWWQQPGARVDRLTSLHEEESGDVVDDGMEVQQGAMSTAQSQVQPVLSFVRAEEGELDDVDTSEQVSLSEQKMLQSYKTQDGKVQGEHEETAQAIHVQENANQFTSPGQRSRAEMQSTPTSRATSSSRSQQRTTPVGLSLPRVKESWTKSSQSSGFSIDTTGVAVAVATIGDGPGQAQLGVNGLQVGLLAGGGSPWEDSVGIQTKTIDTQQDIDQGNDVFFRQPAMSGLGRIREEKSEVGSQVGQSGDFTHLEQIMQECVVPQLVQGSQLEEWKGQQDQASGYKQIGSNNAGNSSSRGNKFNEGYFHQLTESGMQKLSTDTISVQHPSYQLQQIQTQSLSKSGVTFGVKHTSAWQGGMLRGMGTNLSDAVDTIPELNILGPSIINRSLHHHEHMSYGTRDHGHKSTLFSTLEQRRVQTNDRLDKTGVTSMIGDTMTQSNGSGMGDIPHELDQHGSNSVKLNYNFDGHNAVKLAQMPKSSLDVQSAQYFQKKASDALLTSVNENSPTRMHRQGAEPRQSLETQSFIDARGSTSSNLLHQDDFQALLNAPLTSTNMPQTCSGQQWEGFEHVVQAQTNQSTTQELILNEQQGGAILSDQYQCQQDGVMEQAQQQQLPVSTHLVSLSSSKVELSSTQPTNLPFNNSNNYCNDNAGEDQHLAQSTAHDSQQLGRLITSNDDSLQRQENAQQPMQVNLVQPLDMEQPAQAQSQIHTLSNLTTKEILRVGLQPDKRQKQILQRHLSAQAPTPDGAQSIQNNIGNDMDEIQADSLDQKFGFEGSGGMVPVPTADWNPGSPQTDEQIQLHDQRAGIKPLGQLYGGLHPRLKSGVNIVNIENQGVLQPVQGEVADPMVQVLKSDALSDLYSTDIGNQL